MPDKQLSAAERLASLSDEELINEAAAAGEASINNLADLIVDRLNASLIPSSFPAEIGDWIRRSYQDGARIWRHVIPMNGPTCICADYRFNPDGTFQLELQDTNGQYFWRGTFRPVDAERPRE